MGTSFKEIEHKFLVGPEFDRVGFLKQVRALRPIKTNEINVSDTYYVVKGMLGHVFRHRLDSEIEQLTVKSVEATPEVRTEINLNLNPSLSPQSKEIQAFLDVFGLEWQASIKKSVAVAYFDDCEIVFYEASTKSMTVCCVEFEATKTSDITAAIDTLRKYEKSLGFLEKVKESRSLFEILLLPEAPPHVVEIFG